jgi:hypothetical protein
MTLVVGTKYDQGKPRWHLVPPEFEEVVKVLTYGAAKYEERNWERGISYNRIISSTFRHIFSWIKGERDDPETGLHHLAHATCNVLFLLTYEMRGMVEFDDRARKEQSDVLVGGAGVQPDLFTAEIKKARRQLERSNGSSKGGSKAYHPEAVILSSDPVSYYDSSPSSCEPPDDQGGH